MQRSFQGTFEDRFLINFRALNPSLIVKMESGAAGSLDFEC